MLCVYVHARHVSPYQEQGGPAERQKAPGGAQTPNKPDILRKIEAVSHTDWKQH